MSATARSAPPATRRPARHVTAPRSTAPRSTSGASARAAARASARRRPMLVALPQPRTAVAGNGIFALLVVGTLVGGMVVLLVLNTSLSQGAFEMGSLARTQSQLAVEEQRLLQEVAKAEAPESLQRRAHALGMVPVTSPVFLRLADGAVLGVPKAAVAAPGQALPRTGALPAAVTGTAARSTTATTAGPSAAPTAAAPRTDAAHADPLPVSDAARADPATGAAR